MTEKVLIYLPRSSFICEIKKHPRILRIGSFLNLSLVVHIFKQFTEQYNIATPGISLVFQALKRLLINWSELAEIVELVPLVIILQQIMSGFSKGIYHLFTEKTYIQSS